MEKFLRVLLFPIAWPLSRVVVARYRRRRREYEARDQRAYIQLLEASNRRLMRDVVDQQRRIHALNRRQSDVSIN